MIADVGETGAPRGKPTIWARIQELGLASAHKLDHFFNFLLRKPRQDRSAASYFHKIPQQVWPPWFSIKFLSPIITISGARNWTITSVSGSRNIADPFSLFLAPEIVIFWQFLGPEIVKMGQHISGPRNWHYGSVSGARNCHYGSVSGSNIFFQNSSQ